MYKVSVCKEGREIHLSSATTPDAVTRFHAMWLRDNAWDAETRAAGNGQSLIALRDIPPNTVVSAADVNADLLTLTFAPEGKKVDYDINWLLSHAYDHGAPAEPGWTARHIETWDSGLMSAVPVADFESMQNDDQALQGWLAAIARYGFGKLENGPAADQALMQVSKELQTAHVEISDELAIMNLELRAGKRRSESLHNFGERTDVDEVKKLVSVLIQADRFGTSIAQTLRSFSDFMRVQIRQEVEEKAAKIGVKLVFPIFFFILPSLFVVTVGPIIVKVVRDFLPGLNI